MSNAKLAAAKELIQEKRYTEAEVILQLVDHPIAEKWLQKIKQKQLNKTDTKSTVGNQQVKVPKRNLQGKILTQKDRWFSRKFDPSTLEQALNAYGEQGWYISTGATATFPGFFSSNREELVIFMERYSGSPKMEYKILTQKDRWFSGKFNPESIEQAINAYAEQGWSVKQAVTASFPGFFSGNREEIIIILERPVT